MTCKYSECEYFQLFKSCCCNVRYRNFSTGMITSCFIACLLICLLSVPLSAEECYPLTETNVSKLFERYSDRLDGSLRSNISYFINCVAYGNNPTNARAYALSVVFSDDTTQRFYVWCSKGPDTYIQRPETGPVTPILRNIDLKVGCARCLINDQTPCDGNTIQMLLIIQQLFRDHAYYLFPLF